MGIYNVMIIGVVLALASSATGEDLEDYSSSNDRDVTIRIRRASTYPVAAGRAYNSDAYYNPAAARNGLAAPYVAPYTAPYNAPYTAPYSAPYSAPYTAPYNAPYTAPYNRYNNARAVPSLYNNAVADPYRANYQRSAFPYQGAGNYQYPLNTYM